MLTQKCKQCKQKLLDKCNHKELLCNHKEHDCNQNEILVDPKGGKVMEAKVKGVKLTEDPLTNIHIMAPLLDEEGKFMVYGMMYGLCAGQAILNKESKEQKQENK